MYDGASAFGELSLMYSAPRAASIVAAVDCSLFSLDLRSFRFILSKTASSGLMAKCEFVKKVKRAAVAASLPALRGSQSKALKRVVHCETLSRSLSPRAHTPRHILQYRSRQHQFMGSVGCSVCCAVPKTTAAVAFARTKRFVKH